MSETSGLEWGDLGFEDANHGVVVFAPMAAAAVQHGDQTGFPPEAGSLYRTTDAGVHWARITF